MKLKEEKETKQKLNQKPTEKQTDRENQQKKTWWQNVVLNGNARFSRLASQPRHSKDLKQKSCSNSQHRLKKKQQHVSLEAAHMAA